MVACMTICTQKEIEVTKRIMGPCGHIISTEQGLSIWLLESYTLHVELSKVKISHCESNGLTSANNIMASTD